MHGLQQVASRSVPKFVRHLEATNLRLLVAHSLWFCPRLLTEYSTRLGNNYHLKIYRTFLLSTSLCCTAAVSQPRMYKTVINLQKGVVTYVSELPPTYRIERFMDIWIVGVRACGRPGSVSHHLECGSNQDTQTGILLTTWTNCSSFSPSSAVMFAIASPITANKPTIPMHTAMIVFLLTII